MLTWLKFAKRLEQEVAGNINNFKRPSLHSDIYRVRGWGEALERAPPPYHYGLRWPELRNGKRTVWGGGRRWWLGGQPQISLETDNHINGICWRKDLPLDQEIK